MNAPAVARPKAPKMSPEAAYNLYVRACEAADKAAAACVPQPMIVGSARSPLFDDRIDESKPMYYVSEGVCGFAWIKIRPASGPFVNMLKKRDVGYKAYNGGYEVSSWEFAGSLRGSQSMARAEAACRAAAAVLSEAGVECYVQSRMD